MKEEILAFLEWAENNRAACLYYDTGYDNPSCFVSYEVEEIVDDYIKSLEEE